MKKTPQDHCAGQHLPKHPKELQRDSTRRQFLSGLAVGVASTACSGPAARNTAPQSEGGAAGTAGSRAGSSGSSGASGGGAGAGPAGAGGMYGGSGGAGASGAAGGAGYAGGAGTLQAPSGSMHRSAQDRVILGATGIQVSRLAMGSGTTGSGGRSQQTSLGVAAFSSLLVQSYDQGVTFWETADAYGSHPHMREAIRQVGRQNVVVMTKSRAKTASQMEADIARFLGELGTDYIDILLLHLVTSSTWTTELSGAMEAAEDAKRRGVIRAHGVSCHSLNALRLAAKTPWVDVDLARINPAGVVMDSDPETVIAVLKEMKAANKGVIGMKILGEGRLANQLDTAIQHAVRLDCIDAFTIGFTSRDQLDQVTAKITAV